MASVVHVGDDFSGKFLDGLEHVEGDVEPAAGGVHVEDDGVRALLYCGLESAAEDVKLRRGDLVADGDDDDPVCLALFRERLRPGASCAFAKKGSKRRARGWFSSEEVPGDQWKRLVD